MCILNQNLVNRYIYLALWFLYTGEIIFITILTEVARESYLQFILWCREAELHAKFPAV
jgi:hypothetical protein